MSPQGIKEKRLIKHRTKQGRGKIKNLKKEDIGATNAVFQGGMKHEQIQTATNGNQKGKGPARSRKRGTEKPQKKRTKKKKNNPKKKKKNQKKTAESVPPELLTRSRRYSGADAGEEVPETDDQATAFVP